MLATLLQKDIRLAWRNLGAFAINLALPLAITALIGVMFGPSSSGGIPKIKIAVVDLDQSVVGKFLGGGLGQGEGAKYLDVQSLGFDEAMKEVADDKLSAVIVIPENFSKDYLRGQKTSDIRLIKNPAQTYMPAIVEELVLVFTEGLNAISHNLSDELPVIQQVIEEDGAPDVITMIKITRAIGNKLELAEGYLFPPLISYQKESREGEDKKKGGGSNVFAFVLPGLAAMFLLFCADGVAQELYKEQQFHTLSRYRTVRFKVLPFVISKSLYGIVVVAMSSAVILGGGGLIFGISWRVPIGVVLLAVSYSVFCVGFVSLLASIFKTQKRSTLFNSMIIMLMAFVGGSLMPTDNLPELFKDVLAPWLPNFWFVQSMNSMQFDLSGYGWPVVSAKLIVLGAVLMGIASRIFNQMFERGIKA